jgi:5'-methylthioadenosine phosphorylase
MCLATIAVVTDMDAGVGPEQGVQQADVFALFAANTERLKGLLSMVIADLPDPSGCTCETWATGIELTYEIPS